MVKKISSLFLAVFFSLALIGCAGKKTVEPSQQQREYFEWLTRMAVTSEVNSKYGIEPGLTVDKMTVYDDSADTYYHLTFYTEGDYTVMDGSGDLYSGKFKVKGYYESHGSGWDSCEITVPKNGIKELPETIPESVPETSETTTAAETTVLELYSDDMINLSNQYISDGYRVDIMDPAAEFEQCYGAREMFRAYTSDKLVYVYLYDSKEEAENAEFMMYRNTEGTVTAAAEVNTYFIHDTVLVAEFAK